MKDLEFYRPSNIEFDIDTSVSVPDCLGIFENEKEVNKFIAENLVGINQAATVNRFMDSVERAQLRKDYQELLELKLPLLERELNKANAVYNEAKAALSNAKEIVNATTNEAKSIALEVKNNVKTIKLDDQFTWRIPFGDKFYFYTYIDKKLQLCKVADIQSFEKSELFNASAQNEKFFTPETEQNIDMQYLKDEISTEEYIKKSAKKTDE